MLMQIQTDSNADIVDIFADVDGPRPY